MSDSPQFVFFPGMFHPFIRTFLGPYFQDQLEFLDKRKQRAHILRFTPEGTLEENALHIKNELQDRSEIVAFCHSKGGLDLFHALIVYPELRTKFKTIIFMQCPFFGTPLADLATRNLLSRKLMQFLFLLGLSDDISTLIELRQDRRANYMATHKEEIAELVRLIPMQCYGSVKHPRAGQFDSLLRILRDLMLYGLKQPNDGMIPTQSAFLPGLKATTLDDVDHISCVIKFTTQSINVPDLCEKVFSEHLTGLKSVPVTSS